MTNKNIIIAIDGPAGAGKSTVAKKIAEQLNITYLDTGAMYRAVTYMLIETSTKFEDNDALQELLNNIDITYQDGCLCLNGKKIGEEIRTAVINQNVSKVSSSAAVRNAMTKLQRNIGRQQSCIMDGRDVGTVVFPNADVKIFLIADVEKRAQRRHLENKNNGIESSLEEIRESILNRDKQDSERELAPLLKADDAIEIDTSDMNIDEVVAKIIDIYTEKTNV